MSCIISVVHELFLCTWFFFPIQLPLLIPLNIGLIASDGSDIPVQLKGEPDSSSHPATKMINLSEPEATYTFVNVPEEPTLSPMRNFSAPVRVESSLSKEQRAFLLAHDSDSFNRWDAGQSLFTDLLIDLYNCRQQGTTSTTCHLITFTLFFYMLTSLHSYPLVYRPKDADGSSNC